MVRSILYFDLFKYPLTAAELWKATGLEASVNEVQAQLDELVKSGILAVKEGHYALPETISYLQRRLDGNHLATKRLPEAQKSARLIAAFPFVEAVMISGSMSKNYMDAGSDIDFFIVTQPGRLWIARTLLILYKKIFLLNSHRNFCVNYFVDTQHLEIEDKNIFTATETVFLMPMAGGDVYARFREANAWADILFPNFGMRPISQEIPIRRPWMRRTLEWVFGAGLGTTVDAWCMRRTLGRWQAKFKSLDAARFDVALRSRKYVSKHHPSDFQNKVLNRLSDKIKEFETRHQVSLEACHPKPSQS